MEFFGVGVMAGYFLFLPKVGWEEEKIFICLGDDSSGS